MNKSFGARLRGERISQGMSCETVARKLRIRPDIITAIENEDFATMPPVGYSKSMIAAYARLLHLNEHDLLSNYDFLLNEDTRAQNADVRRDTRRTNAHNSHRTSRGQATRRTKQVALPSIPNPFNQTRARIARKADYNHSIYSDSKPNSLIDSTAQRIRSRVSSHPRNQGFPGSRNNGASGLRSKLPFIVIALILVLLLVIAVNLILSNTRSNSSASVNSVPITGLTDPGDTNNVEPPQQIKIAPTAAVFSYEVAADSSAYIEVYIDGASSPSVATTVQGPSYKSYDVTGTLFFVCTSPSNVTCILDGKTIELTDDNNDGVYTYSVDFEKILEAWRAENETQDSSSGTASS